MKVWIVTAEVDEWVIIKGVFANETDAIKYRDEIAGRRYYNYVQVREYPIL